MIQQLCNSDSVSIYAIKVHYEVLTPYSIKCLDIFIAKITIIFEICC